MAISKKPFGVTPDGHDVTQFTLTNARGASVRVINYGAILTNIIVPDRNGVLDDVFVLLLLSCADCRFFDISKRTASGDADPG